MVEGDDTLADPLVRTDEPEDEKDPNELSLSKRKRKRKRKRKATVEDDDETPPKETVKPSALVDQQKKVNEVDRTVYVEGIPFSASPDQVREFFTTEHGIVTITDCRLPVWQDSGRLRGYGHVVFETSEDYKKALALSGKYLQGRYLTIQPANKPKDSTTTTTTTTAPLSEPSRTVVLHNLSYQASEDDIETVMKEYGTITAGGVRVVRHSGTSNSKGLAFVSYETLEAAKKAVQDTTIVIMDRTCRLDYDHGRVRGSFRTADRKLWHKEYGKTK